MSAAANLQTNLEYAHNLAEAGRTLEKLKIGSFEVADIYRAAWTQAVAALDHWVHQEIAERMLRLADQPDIVVPKHYPGITLPLDAIERVRRGELLLRDAVDEYYLRKEHTRKTYQDPEDIRVGLRMVADVDGLWQRVAVLLGERAGSGAQAQGKDVVDRLRGVVRRRNKIVHEYDHDAEDPTGKRPIDGSTTSKTIIWIQQVTEAIGLALDQK
ncbi:hypothetical protein ACQPWY_03720 [Pseudonocardia xinjiangensis]|uniref:hypothetical protein n=1 Tax=Pseudonocardia xinjiangensis TaxID=75289 RepID=UPI003D8A62BF